ncbi:SpoIIE family protein phosphatase [bacterium]|nr:SpoIIE family protein phosphatase [bacterium]
MNLSIISELEPKQFYRRLEKVFAHLETGGPSRTFAARFVREFGEYFSEYLPIKSIVAIDLLGDEAEILYQWGEQKFDLSAEFISKLNSVEIPWVGEWNGQVVAVFSSVEDKTILIVALLQSSDGLDHSIFAAQASLFSSLHYTLMQHVKRLELQDAFDQARAIQISLLPTGSMQFGPYEIAAATVPAHSVGGDVFDFQPVDNGRLSIAIGDASGHGLPAALQARDLIIGLRMGLELNTHIAQIVRKLNSVIHRSGGLASRFASLFCGTLDISGNLTYVNAGHPYPLVLSSQGFQELNISSMILGPYAERDYVSVTTLIEPGSLLALYTDGLIEHSNSHGKEFGANEVRQWMLDARTKNVNSAIEDLFARLSIFGDQRAFRDDATAVLIRRKAEI